jgi:hypothetical protein
LVWVGGCCAGAKRHAARRMIEICGSMNGLSYDPHRLKPGFVARLRHGLKPRRDEGMCL